MISPPAQHPYTSHNWYCATDNDTAGQRVYSSIIAGYDTDERIIYDYDGYEMSNFTELRMVVCFPSTFTGEAVIRQGVSVNDNAVDVTCANSLFAGAPAITVSYDINCQPLSGALTCRKHAGGYDSEVGALVNLCTHSIYEVTRKGFRVAIACPLDVASVNLVSMAIMAIVPE